MIDYTYFLKCNPCGSESYGFAFEEEKLEESCRFCGSPLEGFRVVEAKI